MRDLNLHAPETLRDALERLDALGGRAVVSKGVLVVSAPREALTDAAGVRGVTLIRAIYSAADVIVAAVAKDGPVAPGKLPDRPLLPSGQVAP